MCPTLPATQTRRVCAPFWCDEPVRARAVSCLLALSQALVLGTSEPQAIIPSDSHHEVPTQAFGCAGSRSTGGRDAREQVLWAAPCAFEKCGRNPSAACSRCRLSCRNSIVTARSRSIMMAVVGDDLVGTSAAWLPTRLRPRAGGQVSCWGLRLQHRHLRPRGRTALHTLFSLLCDAFCLRLPQPPKEFEALISSVDFKRGAATPASTRHRRAAQARGRPSSGGST